MPWSTDDIPNLDGCTALVTGANGGLGLETARALAAKGAKVLMAARNQEKAAAAEVEIRAESPAADSFDAAAAATGGRSNSMRERPKG